MISVEIPKEIRDFKEKLFFGLTLRQCVSTAIALIICVPLYIYGRKILGDDIASYLVILIALPCAGAGFYKKNGMVFEKYVLTIIKHGFIYPHKRPYKSENCIRIWHDKAVAEESSNGLDYVTKRGRKIKYHASLQRVAKMIEAEKNGVFLDDNELNDPDSE